MKYLVKIFFLILCIHTLSFGDLINLTKEMQTSILKTYGSDSVERINYLNNLFDTIHPTLPPIAKLNLINNFFNKFTYLKDKTHWKKEDYWSTLIEFVATGAGDSEDFAMAKYFILIKLGFNPKQFELLYDLNRYQFTKIDDPEHIVLSYKHSVDSKAIILDSVSKKLRTIDNPSTYKPILKSEQFIEEHLNNMLVFK
jgi:predicted transglutaminase-like cysteine proteinase